MKRLLIIFSAVLASLLILTACGETESENIAGAAKEEEVESEEGEEAEEQEEQEESEENEINEVIVDSDVKATLVTISKESDSIFGDRYNITFDVENNLDHSIEVQARSLSVDGTMVDEATYSMSQEVAAGKNAKAVLTIEDFDGYDFPEMEEDFEMVLHIFSWDDMDYGEDYDVKIEF